MSFSENEEPPELFDSSQFSLDKSYNPKEDLVENQVSNQ